MRDLTDMRNRVVHLDEMSWAIQMMPETHTETPNSYTKNLTVESLKRHYNDVQDFLDSLKKVLNKAFGNKTIKIEHHNGDNIEIQTHNYMDYIYTTSVVPRLPSFDR